MEQRNLKKVSMYQNTILSTERPKMVLSLERENKKVLKTRTITKRKLIIFVGLNQEKWVDSATAYALALTSVRSIMVGQPRYVKIDGATIERIAKDPQYEILYQELPTKKKEKLMVYYHNQQLYIDMASAYALGMVDVQKFYEDEGKYGPLGENEIAFIKAKYEITFLPLEGFSKEEEKKK